MSEELLLGIIFFVIPILLLMQAQFGFLEKLEKRFFLIKAVSAVVLALWLFRYLWGLVYGLLSGKLSFDFRFVVEWVERAVSEGTFSALLRTPAALALCLIIALMPFIFLVVKRITSPKLSPEEASKLDKSERLSAENHHRLQQRTFSCAGYGGVGGAILGVLSPELTPSNPLGIVPLLLIAGAYGVAGVTLLFAPRSSNQGREWVVGVSLFAIFVSSLAFFFLPANAFYRL